MWISAVLVGILTALLSKYIRDRRRKQRIFEEQGIPGPKPNFVWGNLKELYGGSATKLMEWTKMYGKTFCYYEGEKPILVTSDLDIMKHVLIKDFSNFHSRQFSILFTPDESLVHVEGEVWKRLRMIVSPTFSARRMKDMSPLVNKCVDSLLEVLEKRVKEDKAFNIMQDFQGLTMNAIANCGFGLEIDAISDPDNIFLKNCKKVFDQNFYKRSFLSQIIAALVFLFPSIAPVIVRLIPNKLADTYKWFYDTAAAIIESRRNQATKRNDFIQLMLNAQEHQQSADLSTLEVSVTDDSTSEVVEKTNPTFGKGKHMTLREMQAQCMAFLLAGYETTSTALSFTVYELALHPDIQEKLQQEIDEYFPGDKLPDYLSVQKMTYMDMVFSEVLRLHSIAGVVTIRKCIQDWNINGLHIPKGTVVRIHMEAVHKDSESWGPEDPEEFVPERFLSERKASRDSLAWMPFGGGPRNCIGMRFALMEAKITLARLLKNFIVCRTEETQVPLKTTASGISRPSEGVIIKLERRS